MTSEARRERRRALARFGRILGWIVIGCVLLVAFEMVVYLAAAMLFPHVDTPECASTNTFCSPDGRHGVTGGTVVVAAGHLGALVVLVALLLVRDRRSHAQPNGFTVRGHCSASDDEAPT